MVKMKSVGIIGFGSFGKFLAEQLDKECHVLVYSYSGQENQWTASLEDVAAADFVILAVPLDSYRNVLSDLKHKINKDTVLVDVCSVKVESVRAIREVLPEQNLAATHPLFGPQTAEELAGHILVLCPEVSDPRALEMIEKLAKKLKLAVVYMSADEHDEEMAIVQGLTFFIAHVLKDSHLHKMKLSTPSFKRLLHLAKLELEHSDELFYTIQAGNPKTEAIRKQFIDNAIRLDQKINIHKIGGDNDF